ncbi:MAG: hypothetical protein GY774_04715 [Planctomycetes bacterium]|nr:hypothetical protein [Planctomycetota bacterium]
MSFVRHRTEIETLLMDSMKALHPSLVVIGENAKESPEQRDAWCRMSFTIINITAPCIGGKFTRTDAIFNVQMFTALGLGSGEATALVDDAKLILENSSLTGIEFLNFDVDTGVQEDSWYGLLLRAYYRAQN